MVPKKKENNKISVDLKDLVTNKPGSSFWQLLFTILYVSIRNGAIAYYFKYYVDIKTIDFELFGRALVYDFSSAFMVLGTVGRILGIAVVKKFSDLVGEETGLHDPDDLIHPLHQQLLC